MECSSKSIPISTAVFEKHDYSKPVKKKFKCLEDFDPRPLKYRGTAVSRLPTLLDTIRGQQLCLSLLLDETCQHWPDEDNALAGNSSYHMPTVTSLRDTISAFKNSLIMSEEEIRNIEQRTRDQRLSPLWHSARKFRLTASLFGSILHQKENTPPDELVINLLQQKTFTTRATQYGIDNEPAAISEYVAYQHAHGHPNLAVSPSGFIVSSTHPYLGASPDGAVYDPSNMQQPFGYVEVKCPYTARNVSPTDACENSGFCCTFNESTGCLQLKESHAYYAQIQGQMAIGCRPWCDFVVYTKKGVSVQRVKFNQSFWDDKLLKKLTSFYDNCVAPEIVSPVHVIGIPLRDLSKN